MGKMKENHFRANVDDNFKSKQQEVLFNRIIQMLTVESFINTSDIDDTKEMIHKINNMDIAKYLELKVGEHIACIRPSCKYVSHANLFKVEDGSIWMYSCPSCQAGLESITLFELILEIFKAQYPGFNHNTIMYLIKKAYNAQFTSQYFREAQRRLNYNLEAMKSVDANSYLGKLIKRRHLIEDLQDYSEIAIMYFNDTDVHNYCFYASRQVIIDYYSQLKNVSKGNRITEKINLLSELGFISKISAEEAPASLKKKVYYKQDAKFRNVNVFMLDTITEEQLEKAELKAKAIIENNIYRAKSNLEESIKDATSYTKEEKKFIEYATKAIEKHLENDSYMELTTLLKKIDPKCSKFKKVDKERLLDATLKYILQANGLKKVKSNRANQKKYNIDAKAKGDVLILVGSKNEVEITIIEESRVEKKKKAHSRRKKVNEDKVIKEWIENGCSMVQKQSGEIDQLDIPF